MRLAFESILKRTTRRDTIVLLIASHGTVIETPGRPRGAYIVTHDSDPQDLSRTALPMADIQKLVREDLTRAGRVLAFVDVCRSGTIGTIPRASILKVNSEIDQLSQTEGELFLFMASRPKEVSFEGPQYGGGHGAFSFFLLEALNGAADLNNDGHVNISELVEHVRDRV